MINNPSTHTFPNTKTKIKQKKKPTMRKVKEYISNLIGVDLIIIAVYMILCSLITIENESSIMELMSLGFTGLCVVLISSILATIGLYVVNEV